MCMCNGIYRPLMNWSNAYRIQGLLGTKLQFLFKVNFL